MGDITKKVAELEDKIKDYQVAMAMIVKIISEIADKCIEANEDFVKQIQICQKGTNEILDLIKYVEGYEN